MPRPLETKRAETQSSGGRLSPLAGKPAPREMLVELAQLEREYFGRKPDLEDPNQLVAFGTSGHRGTSLDGTFTEAHVLAITQAICDYRHGQGTDGPVACSGVGTSQQVPQLRRRPRGEGLAVRAYPKPISGDECSKLPKVGLLRIHKIEKPSSLSGRIRAGRGRPTNSMNMDA